MPARLRGRACPFCFGLILAALTALDLDIMLRSEHIYRWQPSVSIRPRTDRRKFVCATRATSPVLHGSRKKQREGSDGKPLTWAMVAFWSARLRASATSRSSFEGPVLGWISRSLVSLRKFLDDFLTFLLCPVFCEVRGRSDTLRASPKPVNYDFAVWFQTAPPFSAAST